MPARELLRRLKVKQRLTNLLRLPAEIDKLNQIFWKSAVTDFLLLLFILKVGSAGRGNNDYHHCRGNTRPAAPVSRMTVF